MKKHFSWYPFDISFIKAVVYSEKTPVRFRPRFDTQDKTLLIPFMENICPIPDVHFVRTFRAEIIESFLAGTPHLVTVTRGLQNIHYRGVQVGSMDSMLEKIRTLRMTDSVVRLILGELYRTGDNRISEDAEFSVFNAPKAIDVANCVPGEVSLHDYQQDALDALNRHYLSEDQLGGILVMPTGSGKTRVAVRFLIESMVARGWQVFWLTHRAMLIEQTAYAVYDQAGALLKLADPDRERFKMICVSGSHASVKATEPDDDVLICGVQSLIRNLPYLQAVIKEKVLIVVDEAHHAVAPSYRLIIQEIQKHAKTIKLLGLTATPVRMSDEGTAKLMALFSNKIIYNVAMNTLIAKGYLADPKFEDVDTNVDFTTTMTAPEKKYLEKWGELHPDMREKKATVKERNLLIADVYMKERARYGKTLIFALNATHCISLCEELQKRGVKCDYIYCAHAGNDAKIERFRKGELDVLVNIQVLTEGSDIPDIQTVFLTRPTQSDVLLMQMIGRGMRGKDAGGTESVNIVSFHDIWDRYVSWLNPRFVIQGELEPDLPEEQDDQAVYVPVDPVPWSLIREIMDTISTRYAQPGGLHITSVLPVGWYDVFDEDGAERKVLVFSSQTSGYKAMISARADTFDNAQYTGEKAADDWFRGFGPQPTAEDLQMMLDTYRLTHRLPYLHLLRDRETIDASLLAGRLKAENVGIADIDSRIEETYAQNQRMIDSLYGSLDEYLERVHAFLLYPNGVKPFGAKIEEFPVETLTLDRTPAHDLGALAAQVADEMFGGNYGPLPPIRWTSKPYTGYFGKYTYVPGGSILINCVLNAEGVKPEVVKYVIYHELLHRDYRNHDKAFHAEEHKYPNWVEHERFLKNTFPKFDLRYSM